MKYINYILPLFLLFIISCSENNTSDENGDGSVFILNQGSFQAGNASITAYDPFTNEVQQNYFSQNNNGRPLGDVAQSASLINDNLFIVVNNSHKIEVVDPETFVASHTINFDNELSPRYIESVGNNKAYITSYTDSVAILDLESMEVTGYIDAGSRTEGLAVSGSHAFVANTYYRDFSAATTVTMINTTDDEIVNTIELREGPSVVKADSQNRIWVVATGPYDESFTHNDAAVYVLNASDGSIIETIELNGGGGDLAFHEDDNSAYISSGGIRVIDMVDLTLSNTPLSTQSFYSLGFDRSVEPAIYAGSDKGAEQSGMAYIYDIEGAVVDSFATGIFPGFFQFSN
ncbi:MAG: DUF5074 domain-containing protein [Balneolales bacterium]